MLWVSTPKLTQFDLLPKSVIFYVAVSWYTCGVIFLGTLVACPLPPSHIKFWKVNIVNTWIPLFGVEIWSFIGTKYDCKYYNGKQICQNWSQKTQKVTSLCTLCWTCFFAATLPYLAFFTTGGSESNSEPESPIICGECSVITQK